MKSKSFEAFYVENIVKLTLKLLKDIKKENIVKLTLKLLKDIKKENIVKLTLKLLKDIKKEIIMLKSYFKQDNVAPQPDPTQLYLV